MMEEIIDQNNKTQAENKGLDKKLNIIFKAITRMEFLDEFHLA